MSDETYQTGEKQVIMRQNDSLEKQLVNDTYRMDGELYPWQQTIWQQVRSMVTLRAHALLLKGRKGIGKLAFAHHLAKSLLCERPTARLTACGQCTSCKWFSQGTHPNFYLMVPEALAETLGEVAPENEGDKQEADAAKAKKKLSQQITIEQVRLLNNFVYLSGHQQGFKVILIHPAEAMNVAAANALLKKLEEPPPNILFLLVAHRWQDLLATIRSRCQHVAMPVPAAASACDWLSRQGVKHPETYLALAGTSPLQAVALSQGDYLTQHAEFIQQISLPTSLDAISLARSLQKLDLPLLVSWLQKWCYDLMSFSMSGKIRYHLQQEMSIKKLAATIDPIQLGQLWRQLITIQQLSRHPLNAKLFIEEMLLSYLSVMAPERYKD